MKTTIIQGETCLQLQNLLRINGSHWCDLVVTSPPYNIGIKYADGVDDSIGEIDYGRWCEQWLMQLFATISPDGHLFLNVGSLSACPMRPFQLLDYATRKGFHLQNTFHWIKSISYEDKEGKVVSRGQFKPINSDRFVNNLHEYVWHLTPGNRSVVDKLAVGVPYQDKTNIERWAGKKDKRCRGNVWFLPYDTIQCSEKQRPHPATFPVALAEMAIRIGGCPRVVLDPFVGSGTAGVAADNCGVAKFIGIDLSSTYALAASKRIHENTPK